MNGETVNREIVGSLARTLPLVLPVGSAGNRVIIPGALAIDVPLEIGPGCPVDGTCAMEVSALPSHIQNSTEPHSLAEAALGLPAGTEPLEAVLAGEHEFLVTRSGGRHIVAQSACGTGCSGRQAPDEGRPAPRSSPRRTGRIPSSRLELPRSAMM